MLLDIGGASLPGRLFPFSAQVAAGELIHVAGPNGAGKSSLLAALAGLLSVQGAIRLDGRNIADWSPAELARRRAFLPQQQPAPVQMPVWHYLRMHEPAGGTPREPLLQPLTDALQIGDKLQRPLGQLSGGEWQRVRLAAVLLQVSQPAGGLLLLDEPLTGLDIAQQHAFDRLLQAAVSAGVTVVMSSHDLNHSLRHASRVWLMRPGKAALQGAPREVLTPGTLSALYRVAFRQFESDGELFIATTG